MIQLYLMRHGQTDANLSAGSYPWDNDCPLNSTGRQQAERAARYLAEQPLQPTRIISSPLTRTRQTAEIVAAQLGLTVETDATLREIDAGEWHGHPAGEVYEYVHALPVAERFSFLLPGGESWQQAGERLAAAARTAVAGGLGSNETVLLVSHYGTLQAGIGTLLGTDFAAWNTYDFPNASLSGLVTDGKTYHAQYIGQAPHGEQTSEVKTNLKRRQA
jgi:broad specificity phosphatase PhoE